MLTVVELDIFEWIEREVCSISILPQSSCVRECGDGAGRGEGGRERM
jgi:hypothetical protein